MYRYKLYSTGYSSARYGACEICNEHVSEVFHQTEERLYTFGRILKWTQLDCQSLYGHKDCLISQQR